MNGFTTAIRRLRPAVTVVGLILISTCASIAGCGRGDGYEGFSGTVTYQGKPLEEGTIQFYRQTEPPALAGGAQIIGGKYELPREHGVKPGTYLVRISSTEREEKASKTGPAMSSFRVRERLPAKYHSQSTLTVEITAHHQTPVNFTLE